MAIAKSYYIRVLIIILSLFILGLTCTSFFLAEPKHQINAGIVTLIAIVVILVLSESFNKLSIGKILSLSREVELKTKEAVEVKSENRELRLELFKIVSNVQQSQVNNTFNTPPDAWHKFLGVVKAEDEVSDEVGQISPPENIKDNNDQQLEKKRYWNRLRSYSVGAGLKKYVLKLPFSDVNFIERVEFSSPFHAIDPIMDKRIVFDGYINLGGIETFIEAHHKENMNPIFCDRLYVMLSKINLYRTAKNTNAELLLLLIETPSFENKVRINSHDHYIKDLQPAIKSGLLRIDYIDVNVKEAEEEDHNQQIQLI